MADETLLSLVADIVSAQVSHNSVSANDLPTLIQSVYASLAKLGEAQAPVEEKREPAVSIRSSVKPDAVTCLECGARFKMLKHHLSTDHNLTPDAYRARWNLPASYPLVAPDYAAKRRELALKIGLGRKPAAAPAPEPVKVKAPRRKKLAPAFVGDTTSGEA
jgi:predicted transcriptional regulator